MREYILSVASAAIVSALSEVLIPKSWQKYASLLTGALLLLTLIKPLLQIRGLELPTLDIPSISYTEYDASDMVKFSLESNIATDIKDRIASEFDTNVNADVDVSTDDEGRITGVLEIRLDIKKTPAIAARLTEIYAPKKITWRAKG